MRVKVLELGFVRRTVMRQAGGGALLAAMLLGSWLGYEYHVRSRVLAGLELRLHAAEASKQRASGPHSAEHRAALQGHAQATSKWMAQVNERLGLPWDALFNELEATVDEHVTLLGVEPDAAKGVLQISAEAADLNAMLAYGKRLSASARFKDAVIISHQVQTQDAQRPVRFVVSAQWLMAPVAGGGL